ncbi:MAG: hypothetical protein HQL97_01295 [Magnetococcales bacterium]|nr:hypothetical protein [Magnetococcales bacterium]
MADLGSLIVHLDANVAKFEQGMKQSEVITKAAMGNIQSFTKTAASFAEKVLFGVAAAWSMDKFISGIKGAQESAAALNALSLKSGVTVESLSSLGMAAKASGTDMDTVAKNAAKLGKAELEAAQGNEKTATLFKSLGISYKDSNGNLRESGDVMIDVAKKLYGLESATTRVALAQQIFGKSGYEILPFLKQLADTSEFQVKATSEQTYESEKLLQSQMKLDARNQGWIKTVAYGITPAWRDFNDALLSSDSLMQKFGKELKKWEEDGSLDEWANTGARAIARFMDGLIWIGGVFKATGVLAAAMGASIAYVFDDVSSKLGKLWDRIKTPSDWAKPLNLDTGLGAKLSAISSTSDLEIAAALTSDMAFTKALEKQQADRAAGKKSGKAKPEGEYKPEQEKSASTTTQPRESKSQWQSFLDSLEDQTRRLEEGEYASMIGHAERLAEWNNKQKDMPFADIAQAYKLIDQVNDAKLATIQKAYLDGLDKETQKLEEQYKMLDMGTLEREKYNVTLQGSQRLQDMINQADKSGLIPSEKAAENDAAMFERRKKFIDELTNSTDKSINAQILAHERLYNYQRTAGYGASQAVKSYYDQATNAAEQMRNLVGNSLKNLEDALVKFTTTGKLDFKSMIDSMINDLARMQVQQSIMGPLSGFLGGIFGGGTSVTGPGFEYSGPTSALEILSGARAGGGPVASGRTYLVGENGPEWFRPDESGTIIPNGVSAMQSARSTGAVSGGGSVEVHIHNATGATPRVSQSTGSGGMPRIDVLLEQFEKGLAGNIMRGVGIAPALEGRYSLSPAMGLM